MTSVHVTSHCDSERWSAYDSARNAWYSCPRKTRVSAPATLSSCHLSESRMVNLAIRTMYHCLERILAFFTRSIYGPVLEQFLTIVLRSNLQRPPLPQTSPSTDSRTSLPDQIFTVSILFPQFSNSQTSSSFPSSLTSLRTRISLVTMHGSAFRIVRGSMIIIGRG